MAADEPGRGRGKRPAPLGRFSRVPETVIRRAHDARLSGMEWAVLTCLHFYADRRDDGTLTASCDRATICRVMGIKPKAASNAIERLKRKGVVAVEEPGRIGRAAVYAVAESDCSSVAEEQSRHAEGCSSAEAEHSTYCSSIREDCSSLGEADCSSAEAVPKEKNSAKNSFLFTDRCGDDGAAPQGATPSFEPPAPVVLTPFDGDGPARGFWGGGADA